MVACASRADHEGMDITVDVSPLKEIQKFLWSQGDFQTLAAQSYSAAETLVRSSGVARGDTVLDVGAGTGNVAAAALSAGAVVTASDLTPLMIEQGRARTGDAVTWVAADAEALPFADGVFDHALSCFGAMFAPRPEVAIAELTRVVRPGGRIGLTAWCPDGYTGRLMETIASFMPPRPAGVPAPLDWGDEPIVRARARGAGLRDVVVARRAVRFSHPSVDAFIESQRATLGPLIAATMVLGDGAGELHDAIRALVIRWAGADGPVVIDSDYLEVVAVKA